MTEQQKKAILKLLEDAEKDKFFGEITFRFRDGNMYQLFKGQSIMVDELTKS